MSILKVIFFHKSSTTMPPLVSFLVEREDQLHCFLWLCQIQGMFRTNCTLWKTCWNPDSSTGMSTYAMKQIVSSAIKCGRVSSEECLLLEGWVIQRLFSHDPKPPGDLHAFLLFLKPLKHSCGKVLTADIVLSTDMRSCGRIFAYQDFLLSLFSFFPFLTCNTRE